MTGNILIIEITLNPNENNDEENTIAVINILGPIVDGDQVLAQQVEIIFLLI